MRRGTEYTADLGGRRIAHDLAIWADELPADPGLVVIPAVALIEEGGASYVFVETNAERLQFTRRKVQVARRGRQTVFVCGETAAAERGFAGQYLNPGDQVVTTMVLELSADLEAAKTRSPAQ